MVLFGCAPGDPDESLGPGEGRDAGAVASSDASEVVADAEASDPDAGRDAGALVPDAGLHDADAGRVEGPDASVVLDGVRVEVLAVPGRALQADLRVTAPVPVTFSGRIHGPGVDRRLQSDFEAAEHRQLILILRSLSTYTVDLEVTSVQDGSSVGATAQFTTGTPPTDLQGRLRVVVDQPSADRGITLFGVSSQSTFVGVDHEGWIVWHHQLPATAGFGDVGAIIRPMPDGNLFLMGAGEYYLITAGGQTLRSWTSHPTAPLGWHHDGVLLPDGTLLGLGNELRQGFVPFVGAEANITDDVVVELDPGGSPVRKWSAFDTLDATRFPGPLSRQQLLGGYDWSHGNSVHYRAADDTYLVSLRNQSWVVNVERASGRVAWVFGQDGDFELLEGQWFTAQHASAWFGDDLILYDNGAESTPRISRAVMYSLDVNAMTARQVWEWRVPFYTPVVGDIDRMSQNWLVTAGGSFGNPPATIFEVTDAGDIRWQLEVEGDFVYRAERVPTLPLP